MSTYAAAALLNSLPNDISEIRESLRSFTVSAATFSNVMDQYREKWVGVYNGHVEAVADTLDQLTAEIHTKNIPQAETLIRYVGLKDMTLIL